MAIKEFDGREVPSAENARKQSVKAKEYVVADYIAESQNAIGGAINKAISSGLTSTKCSIRIPDCLITKDKRGGYEDEVTKPFVSLGYKIKVTYHEVGYHSGVHECCHKISWD